MKNSATGFAQTILQAVVVAQSQFSGGRSAREIFDDLLSVFLRVTESEFGFIGKIRAENGRPFLQTYAISNIGWNAEMRKLYEDNLETGLRFDRLQNLFGHTIVTGQVVISNDPDRDQRSGGRPDGHPPLRAYLGVPFHHRDQMVGMVGIANRPGGYDEDLVEMLEPLITTCGNTIGLLRSERRVRERSRALEDSLAELRQTQNQLAAAEQRARRAHLLSQRQLTAFMENLPAMAFIQDLEGTVLAVNLIASELGGMTPEDMIGRNIHDMFPEQAAKFAEQDRSVMAIGGAATFRQQLVLPSGEGRHHETTKWPLRDEQGTTYAIAGMSFDITERVFSEAALESRVVERTRELNESLAQLKKTQAQLAQASKLAAMGELAAGVAHEINNPLSAVLIMATLLQERLEALAGVLGEAPDLMEQVGLIASGAKQCRATVQNMLSFARESDSVQERVSIAQVVQATVALLKTMLHRRSIHVDVEVDDDLFVLGSRSELQQVFMNLLMNASDAMESGGAIIVVGMRSAGNAAVVEVRDTGSGIPEANLERIFEPFFTSKEPGKGTGLGLAMVYGTVERCGGSIEVQSSRKGTTFQIRFPVVDGGLHRAAARGGSEARFAVEAIAALPRVLLVDDNDICLRAMELSLSGDHSRSIGHLDTAASGLLALERMRGQRYDVLVTDFQMAPLNGIELVAEARSLYPDIAVVLISGHSREIIEKRHDLAGVPLLRKPPEPKDLRAAIAAAWSSHLRQRSADLANASPDCAPARG